MTTATFSFASLLPILPQVGLVLLALIVLVLDLLMREDQRRSLGWVTAGGLVVIAALGLLFSRPSGEMGDQVFGGMLRSDWLATIFTMIFLFGAAITALFAMDSEGINKRGEFYVLLLVATLGMSLMASASDLIMLYLAIETTSIPLYVLAGFLTRDYKSTEASIKYLIFGAVTSAVLLYGFSLIYGMAGTTDLYQIANGLSSGVVGSTGTSTNLIISGVFLLVMVGIGFKISAAPLHFWAPDVYEGAPTPVAGFLSTASKAAGFAVLMRLILKIFYPMIPIPENAAPTATTWSLVVAILAVISMVLGNTLALAQKNIKRLLAYSSIAQAGYMLIGVATLAPLGFSGAVFYLIAYLVTNLAAFGVVAAVGRTTGSDEISAYAGLSRRSPGLALALLVALLSLGGIPPFSGFVAKVLVFTSTIQLHMTWLAVVGIINSVIGLYYYLNVLKVAYLNKPEVETPVRLSVPWGIALAVCVVAILLLGTLFSPWFNWSMLAAFGIM